MEELETLSGRDDIDENDWTFEGFSGELSFFELYGSSQKQYRDAYKIAEELSDED